MLSVMVYSRGFKREGALGAWQDLRLTLVRNGVSELRVKVPAGHPQAVKLRVKGSRLVVTDDESGLEIFAGTVRGMTGSGPGDEQVEFRAESDHRVLNRVLGWPSPAAALSAQTGDGGSGYRRFRAMPLETILKQVAFENAQRLGIPLSMVPTQGRGGNFDADFRFHPVLEHLKAKLDQSNLTVRIFQTATGMRLDVDESTVLRKEVSIAAGTLTAYEWSSEVFDSTRAVIGGQDEGAARRFGFASSQSREDALGWPEEVFVDARDIENDSELGGRGWERLLEDHDTAGLSLTLTQTPSFRYGVHYKLGDTITVQTPSGPIVDRINQVMISFTRDDGLIITPEVGDRSDDPDVKLAQHIRKWAGRVSSLERR